jgi:hypothetical protein
VHRAHPSESLSRVPYPTPTTAPPPSSSTHQITNRLWKVKDRTQAEVVEEHCDEYIWAYKEGRNIILENITWVLLRVKYYANDEFPFPLYKSFSFFFFTSLFLRNKLYILILLNSPVPFFQSFLQCILYYNRPDYILLSLHFIFAIQWISVVPNSQFGRPAPMKLQFCSSSLKNLMCNLTIVLKDLTIRGKYKIWNYLKFNVPRYLDVRQSNCAGNRERDREREREVCVGYLHDWYLLLFIGIVKSKKLRPVYNI